ncbi:MAG: anti-sigma factor [Bryobacteraceae bacterium]|jgi:hypothetical protein
MNCAELEILLCDYLDGTLAAGARAEVEQHLAGCGLCAELARDAAAAVTFVGRAAAIQPPPELMTRILFSLPSAHQARARQPRGLAKWLRGFLQPLLQPRFAMGFAMTILSFSLLGRFAGITPRQLTLDDLRPAKVWQALDDRIYRTWQRTVKFYENLRVVYEIQNQLKEWKQREQEARGRATEEHRAAPPAEAGPREAAGGTPPQGSGAPRTRPKK